MRLYLAGVALPHRGRTGRMVIDLDEDDAATQLAIADLHHRRGELAAASASRRKRTPTNDWLPAPLAGSTQIVTATDRDSQARRRLERRDHRAQCGEGQDRKSPSLSRPRTTSVLFVGNLNYLPNRDAAETCARDSAVVQASLRGCGASSCRGRRGRGRLAHHPGVKVHGFADLDRCTPARA